MCYSKAVMRYRMIDHTGDVGIKVYGSSLPELFKNAAAAFLDILLAKGKITPRLEEKIFVSAGDTEQLLVTWLSELLYLFDTKRLLFSNIEFEEFGDNQIRAVARGELFDPKKHRLKTEIKAVTYHGLKIEKKNSIYSTLVIFDI